MTKQVDEDFMRRVVLNLITALEDRNWEDIEISTGVLATELGIKLPEPLKTKMARAFAEHAN